MRNRNSPKSWESDKPWLPAFLAKLFLPISDWLFNLLDAVRTGERMDNLGPLPPIRQWLRLYRAHDRVFGVLFGRAISSMGFRSVAPYEGRQIWRVMRRNRALADKDFLSCPSPKKRKQFPKPIRRMFALMRMAERHQQNLSENSGAARENHTQSDARPIEAELQFFFRVLIPCWITAKTLPAILLRRARAGDLDALDALLRIDKAVIHDPKISEIIRAESNNPRRARFGRIAKSFSSFIPEFKKPRIKIALISFISAAFSKFGGIDSPELKKLFDNYANSKSGGKTLADPDLPSGLEAFSKAIRRGRREWAANQAIKKAG